MDAIGAMLQVLSVIVGIGGVVLGIVSLNSRYTSGNGGYLIVGGIAGAISLYAIGSVLVALEQMARDARRSAVANERTAQAVEDLLLRDMYGRRDAAARPPSEPVRSPDADKLIADIEANPPKNKPRSTVLRRLDERDAKKPDDLPPTP